MAILSSPPPPAPPPHGTARGQEDDETQYSLHLDALNLDDDDDQSALDSPSVHRAIDRIHSDDIDGPTDFTVNLGRYFKATPRKQPLPKWDEQNDMFDDTADILTNSSPNLSPQLQRVTQAEVGADNHTPRPDQTDFAEPTNKTLQPTVEDYHSDLTPGRPASFHIPAEPSQRRSYSTSRLRQSQTQRPSSPPTVSSMPSPMPHFDTTPNQKPHSLYQELQKLRQHNESLQIQLDTERLSRRQHPSGRPQSTGHSEDANELESLRAELHRMQQESREYHQRLKKLELDLNESKTAENDALKLAQDRAKELDQIHDTEDAKLHNLQVQLGQARDAERQTHNALDKVKDELKTKDTLLVDIRGQLKQSQDNLRETENDMQDLKTWNDHQRKATSEELHRLQQELDDARREIQQTKEDQEENAAVNRSKVDMDSESSASDREQELERQIASLQTQLNNIRNAIEIKDKLIGELKAQIKDDLPSEGLKKQLQQAQDALASKEKAVQAAHEDADTKAAEMTRALAQQLQQARQQLAAYEAGRDNSTVDNIPNQLEAQLQKARSELATILKQHAADKETWSRTDSETQQSHAYVYDQWKKEQDAHRRANEEVRSLREELDMMQHFNRMEDKPPARNVDLGTQHLASSLSKELQALRLQLESQQRQHHDEIERLRDSWHSDSPQPESSALQAARAEYRRTIDLIEEGMTSLRTSRDTFSLRVTELETNLSSANSSLQTTQNSLSLLEADLAAKVTEVQELTSTNSMLQIRLQDAESQLQVTRTELADLHALNADFDARLSDTLKKREDNWRAKVKGLKLENANQKDKLQGLEEERRGMVKALMGFWGREEFGDNVDETRQEKNGDEEVVGQKFRYRFARA